MPLYLAGKNKMGQHISFLYSFPTIPFYLGQGESVMVAMQMPWCQLMIVNAFEIDSLYDKDMESRKL